MAFSGEVTDDESGLEKVTDVFGVGGDHDGQRDPVVRRRPQRGDRVMHGTVAHQRDDGAIQGGKLCAYGPR